MSVVKLYLRISHTTKAFVSIVRLYLRISHTTQAFGSIVRLSDPTDNIIQKKKIRKKLDFKEKSQSPSLIHRH